MVSRKQVPAFVLGFFVIDVALGVGYLCNELVGRPIPILTLLLDLDLENNVSSWYSSIQWFMVALFVGLFAHCNFSLAQRKSWLLPSLSLLFLALSLDEIAQIHEWLGRKSDVLLSGASRHNTLLPETGIWMFVIGVSFAVFFSCCFFNEDVFSACPWCAC